jgi:hypothetical protein
MNSSASPLPLLAPQEIGELLDEAFDLYKKNFWLFFGITILVSAPLSLLQVAFVGSQDARLTLARVTTTLPAILGSLLIYTALTLTALDRLLGRPVTLVAAYRMALRPFLRLLLALLVYVLAMAILLVPCLLPGSLLMQSSPELGSLLLGLGVLVFLVPASVLAIWGMLLIPVAVLEKQAFRVLARCRQLAAGNLWRLVLLSLGLFAVMLVEGLLVVAIAALVIPLAGINPFLPPEPGNTGALLIYAAVMMVNTLLQSIGMPVYGIVLLMTYLDLRIRQEAYDVELLTAAVEARVEAARSREPAGAPVPGRVPG